MKAPVVEVVRRHGPRPVEPPSTPLPPAVLTALAAIVRDMRDVPRDCLRDPAELFIWLRRVAGRVEGVGRMRVPMSAGRITREKASAAKSLAPISMPKSPGGFTRPIASPRDLAEAVFGKGPKSSPKLVERRSVTSCEGRAVPVEIRNARAAGQIEMPL